MLLRWGLTYVFAAATIMLCGVVAWQRTFIASVGERHRVALEKFDELETSTAAERIAAVAAYGKLSEANSQLDVEKRSCEVKASTDAVATEELASAVAAKLVAETARAAAEAKLTTEREEKLSLQNLLAAAQKDADTAESQAQAAVSELTRLQDENARRETGSIAPPEAATPATPSVPVVQPVTPADTTPPSVVDAPESKPQTPAKSAAEPQKKTENTKSVAKPAKPVVKRKPKPKDDSYFSF